MIGLDNLGGPTPALLAEDVERLIRSVASGTPRKVVAGVFGVSERTVYRYAGARIEWVDVDGWSVPFLCRPGRRPVVVDSRRHQWRIGGRG